MSAAFNPNEYWLKRGKSYMQEHRVPAAYHRLQERFLWEILRTGELPMNRILEIGCGFGRITRLLAENFPAAEIVALDLSPAQLENAKIHCRGHEKIRFLQYDFYSGLPIPGAAYDTVVAIEVFLHHPGEVVLELIRKLASISRYVVNIDWSEPWAHPTPEHVWVHDYASLYARAGLQCATFFLPDKIEEQQQKLFIAAQSLGPALLELESRHGKASRRAIAAANTDKAAPPGSDAEWMRQVSRAAQELVECTTPGSSVILVNDDHWGNTSRIPDRRAIPFLENGGCYFGPPADDSAASRELERLRGEGAGYIAFTWNSFWWLEYYAGFHRQLRQRFPCVFENERLVVFELKPRPEVPSAQGPIP